MFFSWPVLLRAGLLALSAAPLPAADLKPFRLPGGAEALHGSLTVFEDRAAGSGRTIDLNVVVLPATGPDRVGDPIFFLAGGPGQAAAEMAGLLVRAAPMRARRDIVLVDQRGTGKSNPLPCLMSEVTLTEWMDVLLAWEFAGMMHCKRLLEADLTHYNTPIAMDDLDDVRAWLGYERINLWGGSYGTRAAMTYIRRHGKHVRTAILTGFNPVSQPVPGVFPRGAQKALDLVLAGCEGDPECHKRFPAIRAELAAVLHRLDEGPVEVTVTDPRSEKTVRVPFSRGHFTGSLLYLLYDHRTSAMLPALIHAAHENHFETLAQLGISFGYQVGRGLYLGMSLTVICNEDAPRLVANEADGETFLGRAIIDNVVDACARWGGKPVGRDFAEEVATDLPILVVSGETDPVTSPMWLEPALAAMPNALHVVLPARGHLLMGEPCVMAMASALLDGGDIAAVDSECVKGVKPYPFAPPLSGKR